MLRMSVESDQLVDRRPTEPPRFCRPVEAQELPYVDDITEMGVVDLIKIRLQSFAAVVLMTLVGLARR